MEDVALFILTEGRFDPYRSVSSVTRATNYADGFFDTILLQNGKPVFWNGHAERIQTTSAYLGLEEVDTTAILKALDALTTASMTPWQRLRLNITRSGGGLYFPERNAAEVVAQIQRLDTDPWESDGVLQAEAAETPWVVHPSDRYKLLARQENVRLALEAQSRGLDELLVLNQHNKLVGCIAGNVLVSFAGKWYTPPLEDGALAGTIRRELLEAELITERSFGKEELMKADAFARINAITGVLPIGEGSVELVLSLRTALKTLRN